LKAECKVIFVCLSHLSQEAKLVQSKKLGASLPFD
jgi:hypothetical protein